jgi:hypothetical protein
VFRVGRPGRHVRPSSNRGADRSCSQRPADRGADHRTVSGGTGRRSLSLGSLKRSSAPSHRLRAMPGDRGSGSRIYWPGSRFDGTGFGQRTGSRSPWCTLTCQESPRPRRTIPARPRHYEPPGQEDRRDDEQASGDYAYPRQCLVQTARPMLGVLRLFGRNAGIICRWGRLFPATATGLNASTVHRASEALSRATQRCPGQQGKGARVCPA